MKTSRLLAAAFAATLVGGAASAAPVVTGFVGIDDVATVEFTIGAGTFLDVTSNGTTDVIGGGVGDTEIAIYSGFGAGATLVASEAGSNGDDDDGFSVNSTLTYGAGSGLVLGDAFNLDGGLGTGEDGVMLAAGDYTLVIGEFSTVFTPVLGDISDFGDAEMDFVAEFFTDASITIVPEPGSLALLGLGGLALLRRRR